MKTIPLLESFEVINNENGTALKFPNGIMVCYHRKELNLTFTASGYCYRATITNPFTFPIPFIANPTITASTANDADYTYCSVVGVIRNKTEISSLTCMKDTNTNGKVVVHYIAWGNWK